MGGGGYRGPGGRCSRCLELGGKGIIESFALLFLFVPGAQSIVTNLVNGQG
jgi:hypothetical protein